MVLKISRKFRCIIFFTFILYSSRAAAQKILSNKQNGSFLIRDSSTEKTSFTLSFRANGKTLHCRNQFEVLSESNNNSLIDIIEDTVKKSQSSVVGFVKCANSDLFPIAVRLIYPICRENALVPSLQNLCISKLVSKVNEQNINSLPLPPKIKEYVRTAYNTL